MTKRLYLEIVKYFPRKICSECEIHNLENICRGNK